MDICGHMQSGNAVVSDSILSIAFCVCIQAYRQRAGMSEFGPELAAISIVVACLLSPCFPFKGEPWTSYSKVGTTSSRVSAQALVRSYGPCCDIRCVYRACHALPRSYPVVVSRVV